MLKTSLSLLPSYTTRDGSTIREMMHPKVHGNSRQSLAQATVPVGGTTLRHRHPVSEELYHVTSGCGIMYLDQEESLVYAGDTVCIAPGQWHWLRNTGQEELCVLCCCSPAYSHEDTELWEDKA